MASDWRDVHVPAVGASLLIRPIPPSKDRQLQRRAMTPTGLDVDILQRLRFRYAVVEPGFTMDEVAAIFERIGPSVQLILDQIEAISGGPRVHVDPRLPGHLHRQALRMAATATAAMRRGDHRPRVRSRRCRGCNTRSRDSRRTGSRNTRAGPSDPDDPEPPGLALWRHPRFGSCNPNLLRLLVREGAI